MTEYRHNFDRTRVELDPDAIAYGFDLMADLAKVRTGQKPLVIGSLGKCYTAGVAAYEIALDDPALDVQLAQLVCEDGEIHFHVFICAKGAPYAREAIEAIFDTIGDVCYRDAEPRQARIDLQMRLGLLLGHAAGEILDFTESEIGQTCPCDCCGGKETVQDIVVQEGGEHVTLAGDDANPGRFVEHSYRY